MPFSTTLVGVKCNKSKIMRKLNGLIGRINQRLAAVRGQEQADRDWLSRIVPRREEADEPQVPAEMTTRETPTGSEAPPAHS